MFNQTDFPAHTIMPEQLIDTYRRFGRFGPAYHITGISRKLEDGEVLMKIHVFENNEDAEYSVSKILMDPTEN